MHPTSQGRQFVRLASLETFVRYVLHCTLNGRDWLDGLRTNFARGSDEFAEVTPLD